MNKEITDIIIETLKEEGFFENEWIEESKFRPRFRRLASQVKLTGDLGIDFTTLFTMAEDVSKMIIKENVDNTLDGLVDKGLVEEVATSDGVTAYKLNKDYKNE